MIDGPEKVSIPAAIDLIGAALFGADWIGGLTEKELATLNELGPNRGDGPVETIKPCPENRRAHLDRVMGHKARMHAQRNTALDWINCHHLVFGEHYSQCDRSAVKRAVVLIRSNRRTAKPDGIGNKLGRPPKRQERVIAAMLADLQSSALAIETLRIEKQEILAKRYNAARGTCDKARKVAIDEWETRSRAR